MKLTLKGIGWLIFGLLIIASSVETYGWADKLSIIGIGLTLVLVYVMKQFFKPRWYGFFIAGGIMLSFCIYNGINEELIMPLAIAVACLGAFYVINKRSVDEIMDDIDSLGDDEIENFDYVAPETYEEAPADASASDSAADADSQSSDGTSDSAADADSSGEDGAIEIETKIPAPKAKTVEFDFEPKKSKKSKTK